MMYEITDVFSNDIMYEEEGPLISLYQPTHRKRPDNKQDIIRFKNLVQRIENSLKQKYPKREIPELLKPFKQLAEDKLFWNNTTDGLAILANRNKCVVYKLERPVEELSVVANSWHIKPLIRAFQSAEKFHILGLNRKEFALYEGNRYGFREVEIDPDVPRTINEVLGDEYSEPYISLGTYAGAGKAMFHGHGGRQNEIDKDTEKYFRYVDRFILDTYSNPTRTQLILVSLDAHQGLFRNITKNPYLIDEGVRVNYETLSIEDLREAAWKVIESYYLEKTRKLVDRFNLQRSKFLGSDILGEVARSVFEGRVDTLIIEADRIEPGRIDEGTGRIEEGDLEDPEINDVLNDLAKMVYKNKGEVIILPKERMPSETGVAAIYRY
ncbi:MAG TPA: hypothetical protein VFC98_05025 [Clostridia bacterium]|nr:hypothetical protein [Clostridia bacterium]